jgi:hypothetical protein
MGSDFLFSSRILRCSFRANQHQSQEDIPMKKLISCAFNMDTACVELRFTDGSICSIDCTAVENEVADNRFQRAELDYLIYNDPLAYADLVLNGDVEAYLNAVTEYQTYEK